MHTKAGVSLIKIFVFYLSRRTYTKNMIVLYFLNIFIKARIRWKIKIWSASYSACLHLVLWAAISCWQALATAGDGATSSLVKLHQVHGWWHIIAIGAHWLSTILLNNTRTFFTRLRQWSGRARDICVRAIINRIAWLKLH